MQGPSRSLQITKNDGWEVQRPFRIDSGWSKKISKILIFDQKILRILDLDKGPRLSPEPETKTGDSSSYFFKTSLSDLLDVEKNPIDLQIKRRCWHLAYQAIFKILTSTQDSVEPLQPLKPIIHQKKS